MNDLSPGIGHNQPPPEVAAAEYADHLRGFVAGWKTWEASTLDASTAPALSDFVTGASKLREEIDAKRAELKRPHDDAAKAVQAAFLPSIEALALIVSKGKDRLTAHMELAATAALEAWTAEKDRIEAAIASARSQMELASAEGEITEEIRLQKEIDGLEKELKALGKPPKVKVTSATGGGKTRGIREIKSVRITNLRAAFLALQDEPEIAEAIVKVGTRKVRAKDWNGQPIPGLEIFTERSAT